MSSPFEPDRPSREPGHSTETDFGDPLSSFGHDPFVPGLTVLYHADLHRVGERAVLLDLVSRGSGTVELSRRRPDFAPPAGGSRRPLEHSGISRRPMVLRRGVDGGLSLDTSGTRTPVAVNGDPVRGARDISKAELDHGVVLLLGIGVVVLLHRLDPVVLPDLPTYGLIGESSALQRVRAEVGKVCDLAVPVLLRGETGTGKELVARAIHDAGSRRDRPFVAVNMAALPPSLAAAELFGSERGAFTGADRRRQGLFQRAHTGTLFLDEVGEAPPEVQAMLLRTLETGEVRSVGSEEARNVDVRLISATDADLEEGIAEHRFRAPLLHRLSGFDLRLPPLRQRRDDFGRLLKHFLCREMEAVGEEARLHASRSLRPGMQWLPAEAVARMAVYPWPGNVRQLLNVVRQIVIAGRGEARARLPEAVEILLAGAPSFLDGQTVTETPQPSSEPASRALKPSEIDDQTLVELLRAHRFNVRAAAAAADISPTSLYALIEACPLVRKPADLQADEVAASLERAQGDVDAAAMDLEVSSLGLKRRLKELGLR